MGKSGIVFWVCLITAAALLVAGFIVPPMGVIDGSVLSGVGELFAFAALGQIPAIVKASKTAKITAGNKTIEITGKGDHTAAESPDK